MTAVVLHTVAVVTASQPASSSGSNRNRERCAELAAGIVSWPHRPNPLRSPRGTLHRRSWRQPARGRRASTSCTKKSWLRTDSTRRLLRWKAQNSRSPAAAGRTGKMRPRLYVCSPLLHSPSYSGLPFARLGLAENCEKHLRFSHSPLSVFPQPPEEWIPPPPPPPSHTLSLSLSLLCSFSTSSVKKILMVH